MLQHQCQAPSCTVTFIGRARRFDLSHPRQRTWLHTLTTETCCPSRPWVLWPTVELHRPDAGSSRDRDKAGASCG